MQHFKHSIITLYFQFYVLADSELIPDNTILYLLLDTVLFSWEGMFVSSPGLSLLFGRMPWELQIIFEPLPKGLDCAFCSLSHASLLQCNITVLVMGTYIFMGCL